MKKSIKNGGAKTILSMKSRFNTALGPARQRRRTRYTVVAAKIADKVAMNGCQELTVRKHALSQTVEVVSDRRENKKPREKSGLNVAL